MVPRLVWILIGVLAALALALLVRVRFAAMRARGLARQRQALLEDVGLLQAALLPVLPDRLGTVGTSAAYRPADGPGAGGDFYDLFPLADGRLAVVVGDISGHGRGALPHTALVRFTLRAYLEAGLSPRNSLQVAAPVLDRQLGGLFATVVVATYDPRERVLVYACAGHPPPVIVGSRPISPITACSSPPLGAGLPTGRRQTAVSLPGRSLACFYTDGVIEANVAGELFGSARLTRTVAELGPDGTATALLDLVAEAADERPDDMAACLLRFEGDPSAPAVRVEELELDVREAAGVRATQFLRACGVEREEIAEIMRSARAAVGQAGVVVLEVSIAHEQPKVALRRPTLALLHGTDRGRANARRMTR